MPCITFYLNLLCVILYSQYILTTFSSYDGNEQVIGDLAKAMGFTHVSLSSKVMPMVRMVPRGYTGDFA